MKNVVQRVERHIFRWNKQMDDINGALNILRKVIGDRFITNLVSNRGLADNPVRINPYKYSFDKVNIALSCA